MKISKFFTLVIKAFDDKLLQTIIFFFLTVYFFIVLYRLEKAESFVNRGSAI